MRIIWHSVSLLASTGYGVATKEMTKRLRDAGHFVRIGTKHGDHGWYEVDGVEVFDGTDTHYVNQMLEEDGFDYIITCWDIWGLHGKRQYPKEKWVAYVPIDTEWISKHLAEVAKNAGMAVAMTRHGERELKAVGIDPVYYAPLGFDEKTFKIKPEGREAFRRELGFTDENFVVGTVGLNYGDDRKGFIQLLQAFREFYKRHPEARLYIHSCANERETGSSLINYSKLIANLGLKDSVYWPPQIDVFLNRVTPDWLADIYNGFDVFCLATKGEGFGLPIVEAQACGVPVIVTNTTSGPELCWTGWLIEVDDLDDRFWVPSGQTWRMEPRPSRILAELERAYEAWKTGGFDHERISHGVKGYTWDAVWREHWLPVIAEMEARLPKPS